MYSTMLGIRITTATACYQLATKLTERAPQVAHSYIVWSVHVKYYCFITYLLHHFIVVYSYTLSIDLNACHIYDASISVFLLLACLLIATVNMGTCEKWQHHS